MQRVPPITGQTGLLMVRAPLHTALTLTPSSTWPACSQHQLAPQHPTKPSQRIAVRCHTCVQVHASALLALRCMQAEVTSMDTPSSFMCGRALCQAGFLISGYTPTTGLKVCGGAGAPRWHYYMYIYIYAGDCHGCGLWRTGTINATGAAAQGES